MSSWTVKNRDGDVALSRTHVMNYHGGYFKKITTEWRIATEGDNLVARVSQHANGKRITQKYEKPETFASNALDTKEGRSGISGKIGVETFMLADYREAVIEAKKAADEAKRKTEAAKIKSVPNSEPVSAPRERVPEFA